MEEGALSLFRFVRLSGVLPALTVLVVCWLAARGLANFAERWGQRFTDRRLLIHQVSTIGRFFLYLGGFAASSALIFELTSEMWLAVGGTVAVAVGFALKDVAAAVLSGLTIILDRPFQVGDRVSFAGYYGEVQKIGLRSVRLVTLDDNLVTIPNNKFLTEAVSSGNAGALDMLIQIDFHIGVDQDLGLAKRIVRDAITSSRFTFIGKPWAVLVSEVVLDGYFALRVRAKAYVLDVRFEKAFETDVTERVHAAFREHGVRPPAVLHRRIETIEAA